MNLNIFLKNKIVLKIVFLIRSILYIPLKLFLISGNIYAKILRNIDRRNHDAYWQEIMQKSIDSNTSDKIKISDNQSIKFYCPSKISSFRAKTFFSKEPETIKWMNDSGSENKVFYDIGANMGIYSIYYAKKFKSKVFSFEPAFKNLDLLSKNIKLNSLENKIVLIPNPISNKAHLSDFFQLNTTAGGSTATFNDEDTKKIHLNKKNINLNPTQYRTLGLSIDSLIDENLILAPDLIKIDVDGNEEQIIKGCKKTIQKIKKISLLIENNTFTTKNTLENELLNCGLKKVKQFSVNSIWEK